MPVSIQSLGLDRLSVEERLTLIDQLWDSIEASHAEAPPIQFTEAQRAEVERRLEKYRDDPAAGTPWDEVKARLQERRRESVEKEAFQGPGQLSEEQIAELERRRLAYHLNPGEAQCLEEVMAELEAGLP
jgi:putative addiction module component (TIGR02574 family)